MRGSLLVLYVGIGIAVHHPDLAVRAQTDAAIPGAYAGHAHALEESEAVVSGHLMGRDDHQLRIHLAEELVIDLRMTVMGILEDVRLHAAGGRILQKTVLAAVLDITGHENAALAVGDHQHSGQVVRRETAAGTLDYLHIDSAAAHGEHVAVVNALHCRGLVGQAVNGALDDRVIVVVKGDDQLADGETALLAEINAESVVEKIAQLFDNENLEKSARILKNSLTKFENSFFRA